MGVPKKGSNNYHAGVKSELVDSLLASSRFGPPLMEKCKVVRTGKRYSGNEAADLSQVFWSVAHNQREDEDHVPDPCVPPCMFWDQDEVASWLKDVGYPQYEEIFSANIIDGRKLMWVDASKLIKMGISNFDHVRDLSAAIRFLIKDFNEEKERSVAVPPLPPRTAFLRIRSRTHKNPMVYKCFLRKEGYDGVRGCSIQESFPLPTRCCIFASRFIPEQYTPPTLDETPPADTPPYDRRCSRCIREQGDISVTRARWQQPAAKPLGRLPHPHWSPAACSSVTGTIGPDGCPSQDIHPQVHPLGITRLLSNPSTDNILCLTPNGTLPEK